MSGKHWIRIYLLEVNFEKYAYAMQTYIDCFSTQLWFSGTMHWVIPLRVSISRWSEPEAKAPRPVYRWGWVFFIDFYWCLSANRRTWLLGLDQWRPGAGWALRQLLLREQLASSGFTIAAHSATAACSTAEPLCADLNNHKNWCQSPLNIASVVRYPRLSFPDSWKSTCQKK